MKRPRLKRVAFGVLTLLLGILLFAPIMQRTRAQSYTLGANLLLNSDFETGTLDGWNVTGICSVSSTIVHSGSYSAYVSDVADDNGITQELNLPANNSYQTEAWIYPLKVGTIGQAFDAYSQLYLWFYNKSSMEPVFHVSYIWCWNDYIPEPQSGAGNSSNCLCFLLSFNQSEWNLLDRNVTQDIGSSQFAGIDLSQLTLSSVSAAYHFSNGNPGAFYIDDLNLSTQHDTIIVPDDYPTIQAAINAASDGDTVFVRSGTYYEHVTINKTIELIGENRNATIIDNEYKDPPEMMGSVVLVKASNVKMSGFTIQHCRSGGNAICLNNLLNLTNYVNLTFSNNIITGCNEGVRLVNSSDNLVSDNIVQDCYYNTGVGIDWGANNTVFHNTIIHNHYGISGGIDCHGNTFSENTIINNDIGFGTTSYDNKFFHNNFVNNGVQVITSGTNQFDDGYPYGGNFWSDYNGKDLHSGPCQNATGSDGIGDKPYIIDANNMDSYPLMKTFPWSDHDIGITYIGRVYSFDLSVVPLKTIVGLRFSLNISTFLMNYGNQTETFNVQVHANDTLVGTFANVTLAGRQSAILTLRWNTTGLAYGNYIITAVADNLTAETDISDNVHTDGVIYVGIPGDINGDGRVDMRDIGYMARRFGANPQNPIWDPNADLNDDEKIDMFDIGYAARHFMESYS